MQEHIDAAEVVSGQVDLLTVEASLDIILAQHFFHLQQQRTGAAGRVYQDLIFDTKQKAFSGMKIPKKA